MINDVKKDIKTDVKISNGMSNTKIYKIRGMHPERKPRRLHTGQVVLNLFPII